MGLNGVGDQVPIGVVGFGNCGKRFFKIVSSHIRRHGRYNPADRFSAAFDDEFIPAIANPIDDIGQIARGFRGGNAKEHIIIYHKIR